MGETQQAQAVNKNKEKRFFVYWKRYLELAYMVEAQQAMAVNNNKKQRVVVY